MLNFAADDLPPISSQSRRLSPVEGAAPPTEAMPAVFPLQLLKMFSLDHFPVDTNDEA